MQHDAHLVSLAGGEERIPVITVYGRQVKARWQLGEANGVHSFGSDPFNLLRGEFDIPERDDAKRDQPAVRAAAPFVDLEVVVSLDAELGEFLVFAVEETLTAEANESVREAGRGFDSGDVHVGEAVRGTKAAGAHLVVGDRVGGELVEVIARRRADERDRDNRILVMPDVCVAALVVIDERNIGRNRWIHAPSVSDDSRPDVPVALGEPAGPQIGRLHQVVVRGNDQDVCAQPALLRKRTAASSRATTIPASENDRFREYRTSSQRRPGTSILP